jgi:hypothetical protein
MSEIYSSLTSLSNSQGIVIGVLAILVCLYLLAKRAKSDAEYDDDDYSSYSDSDTGTMHFIPTLYINTCRCPRESAGYLGHDMTIFPMFFHSGSQSRSSVDADLVFTKGPVFFLLILAYSLHVVGVVECPCVKTLPCSLLGTDTSPPLRSRIFPSPFVPRHRECRTCQHHHCSRKVTHLKCTPAGKLAKCTQCPHMALGTQHPFNEDNWPLMITIHITIHTLMTHMDQQGL